MGNPPSCIKLVRSSKIVDSSRISLAATRKYQADRVSTAPSPSGDEARTQLGQPATHTDKRLACVRAGRTGEIACCGSKNITAYASAPHSFRHRGNSRGRDLDYYRSRSESDRG